MRVTMVIDDGAHCKATYRPYLQLLATKRTLSGTGAVSIAFFTISRVLACVYHLGKVEDSRDSGKELRKTRVNLSRFHLPTCLPLYFLECAYVHLLVFGS